MQKGNIGKVNKYSNSIRNLCIILLGLALALILSEAIFRKYPKLNFEYRLNNFETNEPRVRDLNLFDWFSTFRPSSILGYERIPYSAPGINSYGMIGEEYPLRKSKNIFRILILGDSITQFDWYVRGIKRRLNNNPRLRRIFELWNAGVTGYEVNQYANYLKFKGIKYNPDMVIIGFCLNDFNIPGTLITYKDTRRFLGYYYSGSRLSSNIPINLFLFKHSYLYRYVFITIDRLLARNNFDRHVDYRIRTGTAFLKEIKKICNNKKIMLLAVIFPYLKPINEYFPYELEEYKNIVRVLEDLKIDYLDLHSYFPAEQRKSLRLVGNDYIHPSKQGHEIAAQAIYEHLIKNIL